MLLYESDQALLARCTQTRQQQEQTLLGVNSALPHEEARLLFSRNRQVYELNATGCLSPLGFA
jgi:hypothetical protein